MKHPDRELCLKYLSEYDTPPHVIEHCKGVAAVAYRLAAALNRAGGTEAAEIKDIRLKKIIRNDGRKTYLQDDENSGKSNGWRELDLDLILSSGLLHDMARKEEDHGGVCADWCHNRGYIEEEQIVRAHMYYSFTNDENHLTETDMVCLGDRLVKEDRYVGLDERIEYVINKAERNGNYSARPIILKKKEETRRLLNAVEERIGMTIDELMKDIDYNNVECEQNDR